MRQSSGAYTYHCGIGLHDFQSWLSYYEIIANTLVNLFNPQLVLDIGCAFGWLVYAFEKLGVKAYGVDISKDSLSKSPYEVRRRLFRVNIECESLPFPNNYFDLETCTFVLEHLSSYDFAISEIARTLRPEGHLFISIPSPATDIINKILNYYFLSRLRHASSQEKFALHVSVYPKAFWIKAFKLKGFRYIGDFPRSQLIKAYQIKYNTQRQEMFKRFDHEYFITKLKWLTVRSPFIGFYHRLTSYLLFKRAF